MGKKQFVFTVYRRKVNRHMSKYCALGIKQKNK